MLMHWQLFQKKVYLEDFAKPKNINANANADGLILISQKVHFEDFMKPKKKYAGADVLILAWQKVHFKDFMKQKINIYIINIRIVIL